jgi:hypothetical protein
MRRASRTTFARLFEVSLFRIQSGEYSHNRRWKARRERSQGKAGIHENPDIRRESSSATRRPGDTGCLFKRDVNVRAIKVHTRAPSAIAIDSGD